VFTGDCSETLAITQALDPRPLSPRSAGQSSRQCPTSSKSLSTTTCSSQSTP
jgi:hypothetical protein